MAVRPSSLQVQEVNCFYNYTVGLDVFQVDLLHTAGNLLKSGIARAVCFSDLKAVYLNGHGEIELEWLRPQGRRWDSHWTVQFSKSLPESIAEDLVFCLELSFHEQRIEGVEVKRVSPYLRAALPPVILENDDLTLPIYPWLKLHADGVMAICFQVDTAWDNLGEEDFIHDIVNLFQRYFKRVWVQAELQRIDGEQLLPRAFENDLSVGGHGIFDRRARKLVKEMRQAARASLDESLSRDGRRFDLHGESWLLHQIAGSEEQAEWEGTIDLCRSIYVATVASQVVSARNSSERGAEMQLWQGRPSISLMRFADQPQSKDQLFGRFGPSLSRILTRVAKTDNPPPLPPDLRLFDDYCFHGNRGLLLWTWLRPVSAPEDIWDDPNTRVLLLENQARAEHFEYHNMRIARACAIASAPSSDEYLVYAYETLANAEAVVHQSSQAGEITNALEFLMAATGTMKLVASGKEQARWHLDERRFRMEKKRSRLDRWLAIVFGFVGAAGLADLVIKPFLKSAYPNWVDWRIGLAAFIFASSLIGVLAVLTVFINNKNAE